MPKRVKKCRSKKQKKVREEEHIVVSIEDGLDEALLTSLIRYRRKTTPLSKHTYNLKSYSTERFCDKKGV